MEWTIDCQQAFQKLKDSLTSAPVLSTLDYSKDFVLQTDSSDRGIGAVLSQQDEHGSDKPIAYFSKKLPDREIHYSTVEKECLAIVSVLKHFEAYLLGRAFQIQTGATIFE